MVITHDELLATIDWIGNTKNGEASTATNLGVAVLASLNALRAVVELHSADIGTPIDEPISVCDWCKVAYPCPTIQAIEKELEW
jgi:hypothetical protein